MRRFQPHRSVYLIPLVLVIAAMVGCPPPVEPPRGPRPGPSVTTPPALEPEADSPPAEEPAKEAASGPVLGDLVPVALELPAPAFRGTPVPLEEPNVEKPRGTPRPPFLAPEGTANLAWGKPVSASDPAPAAGELDFVTDG
ncbi:MAG: hypothetical protein ABIK89_11340, partial [Planctomycetota bacterium]